jgi:hypothetical protein
MVQQLLIRGNCVLDTETGEKWGKFLPKAPIPDDARHALANALMKILYG